LYYSTLDASPDYLALPPGISESLLLLRNRDDAFFYETVLPQLMEFERSLSAPPTMPDMKSLGNRKHLIEILCACGEGENNAEIGIRLGLSEQTVKNLWVIIKERLGAVNIPHAIAIAIRSGIIKIEGDNVVPGDKGI
jgi:DNA-binding CsgD family transcriptional regulator